MSEMEMGRVSGDEESTNHRRSSTPTNDEPLQKKPRQDPTPMKTNDVASTSKFVAVPRPDDHPSEEEDEEEEEEYEIEDVQPDGGENSTPVVTLGDPDLLNCPICIDTLRSPIYQCDNGHIACGACCEKIRKRCPSCTWPIGYNRCIVVEKIVESAITSCCNMQYGCKEKIRYFQKLDHEKTCKYAPVLCPCPPWNKEDINSRRCKYVGVAKCLYMHYVKEHPAVYKQFRLNTVLKLSMGKNQMIKILGERKEHLLFAITRDKERFGNYLNVICIAQASSDMKFSYDLTIRGRGTTDSINIKSSVEVTPEWFAKPRQEKHLLLPIEFYSKNWCLVNLIDLELIIRKAS